MTDQAVNVFDRSVTDGSGGALTRQTGERLIADGRIQSGAISVPADPLDSVNVNCHATSDGSVTHYPNGVKVGRIDGDSYSIEAPPSGKGIGNVVYDAHHKVVAKIDSDQTWHVFTKNGAYTESADGKVTFKLSGHNTGLESLSHLLHDAHLARLQRMRARAEKAAKLDPTPERNLLSRMRSAGRARALRSAELRAKGYWFDRRDATDTRVWLEHYHQDWLEQSEAYLATASVRMLTFFKA